MLHRRRDQLVHHAGGRIGLPAFVGSDPAQSTLRAARDTIQRLRRLRDHREDGGEVAGERRTSRRRFEPRWRGASDGASFNELWVSTGVAGNATLVKDINTSAQFSFLI